MEIGGALIVGEEVGDDWERDGIADILCIAAYGLEGNAHALPATVEDWATCSSSTAAVCGPRAGASMLMFILLSSLCHGPGDQ